MFSFLSKMEIQHLPFIIFISLVLLLSPFFLLFQKWKTSKSPNKKLPPGPWRLPLIGNMHQLMSDLPHRSLRNLSRKYGPIMHLCLGEISVIVVSSPEMAKEIMKTQDLIFATRPKIMSGDIIFYNATDVGFCPYGDYWRNMRKVCILELLSAKMVKSFDSIRQEEMSSLISSIRSTPADSLINLSNRIFWFTNSVTCRSTSGRVIHDRNKLIMLVKNIYSLCGGFDLTDLFPSQKWLHNISGMKSKLSKAHSKVDEILEKIINDHRDNRAKGKKCNGESGNEDLVDALLRVMESGEFGLTITNQNIKAVILDMFAAGTETASATIIWAFLEMIKNPSVMAKAQLEVRERLNGKKAFDVNDLEEFNYLKLVIKETLRLHPPAPLLLPRESREESKIDGYTIPIKTTVLVNAWAIGRDPKYWHNSESFIPERFENSTIDFRGNHFEFIPFGAGRRICPGILFGLVNTAHPLSQLLYHFDWKVPDGVNPNDLDTIETEGLTARRKNDLCLIATPFGIS
ncbi:premnaspirodiene oxygenase-like [Lycium ferocissimum]|uniref:premnaspirodiene oxygenase-like n=1 Tax=Lycium ferocissimum TaxID=112874 RepID=UPI002815D848|nr:premnaspirodiene oxygenase-like [Lycium ferocissimum]